MIDVRDVYNKITRRIVADLEPGVRPWMQPWSAEAAQTAGTIATRSTTPSPRQRHQTDDRIPPGAEARQAKQPNPPTAGFAASQRVEKRRQKYRPSRRMPLSTGTATSS